MKIICIVLSVMIIFFPAVALAYIGPGPGLSAIGSFLALFLAVFVAIFGFIWYPFKRLLRGKKANKTEAENESEK